MIKKQIEKNKRIFADASCFATIFLNTSYIVKFSIYSQRLRIMRKMKLRYFLMGLLTVS